MTKPPTDVDPPKGEGAEVLDELDDDAIVAAQSAAHVPKPRQAVRMDDESFVIADEAPARADPERPGRQTIPRGLPAYRRNDATIVLKRPPGLGPKTSGVWWIWVGAGVLAFGFGGALAIITRDDGSAGKGEAVSVPTSEPATPAPTSQVVVPPPAAPEPERDAASAVSPAELPVERAAPRVTPRSAPRSAPASAPPAAPPAKPTSDIPSKI